MLASDTSCAAQASRPPEHSQPHQLDSGTPSWVPTTLRSYACLLPFTLSFLAMQQGSAHPPPPVTPASSMVSGNPAEVGRLKHHVPVFLFLLFSLCLLARSWNDCLLLLFHPSLLNLVWKLYSFTVFPWSPCYTVHHFLLAIYCYLVLHPR